MKSLWIKYVFLEFQWICSFKHEFAVCHVNYHWINLNQLSIWLIHLESSILSANALLIQNQFCIFIMNPLSVFQNHYEFTMYFANSIYLHYLIPEFIMNTLLSRNQYEFTMCFAFHYEYTTFSWIHYLFR